MPSLLNNFLNIRPFTLSWTNGLSFESSPDPFKTPVDLSSSTSGICCFSCRIPVDWTRLSPDNKRKVTNEPSFSVKSISRRQGIYIWQQKWRHHRKREWPSRIPGQHSFLPQLPSWSSFITSPMKTRGDSIHSRTTDFGIWNRVASYSSSQEEVEEEGFQVCLPRQTGWIISQLKSTFRWQFVTPVLLSSSCSTSNREEEASFLSPSFIFTLILPLTPILEQVNIWLTWSFLRILRTSLMDIHSFKSWEIDLQKHMCVWEWLTFLLNSFWIFLFGLEFILIL